MWINRDISPVIQRLASTFPSVVLTGARQTGKTSLLKRLFPKNNFVSLDLPSIAEMAETTPEAFLDAYPPPVTIDEVQYAPNLFRYLKNRIDQNRHVYGQYILTGSQKFTLMKGLTESLAGRCGVCELETLSLEEIRQEIQFPTEELIVRGGYPELYAQSALNHIDYYSSYLATYLERDVRAILGVKDLRDFQRFIRACALRSGQLLNKSELARDVGIRSPTANEWLSVLQASNQILLLEPWLANKTKSLVKAPKLYLADTGLLCFLANIRSPSELLASPLLGSIWETFVYAELRKHFHSSREIWYWRDQYGLEVDFLMQKGGRFHLMECKWSEHPQAKDTRAIEKVCDSLGRSVVDCAEIISRTKSPYTLTIAEDLSVQVVALEEIFKAQRYTAHS
ncbi:MAG: ATP-binding protein [Bdellovibrionales bacterium]|nr:ATP-binding protein [Bdellovibrionales bacterium]